MSLLDSIPMPVAVADFVALEWPALVELVAGFAASAVGREAVKALVPSTDEHWIVREHSRVDELRVLLACGASVAMGGLFDPERLVAKAAIEGAALEAEELVAIARLAHDVAAWQRLMLAPPARAVGAILSLQEMASALVWDLQPMAESIEGKFLPDGSLSDDASPALGRIRREQDRQQRAIEESLRSALRRLSSDGATQEDVITIRGERFVIPVKVEQKRRVGGVVHGASSSGQTVYVEPLETIEQNNELVRLLEEEQAEIHRIFVALTGQVAQYAGALLEGSKVLAAVDVLMARARFAEQYDCVRPVFDAGLLRMESARHPLLERRLKAAGGSIIPLTMELTGAEKQIIISGPNTGGKTVTLKTVGLLAMMAQAGIPVPAVAATVPVCDAFLADIGDAQSIERALSTFSAHITNLERLARVADVRSLVLLDELGSATDPDEGSALAVAIAAFFLERQSWTLISTHHTSLKVYAANTEGVLNAAAGVDELTLAPNYQLRLGVPGASAGIATAERLGLNAAIVTAARERMGTQQVDLGRFLDRLHSELEQLEVERKAAREEQYALNQERARLEREGKQETQRKVRELEQKLASLVKDFEFQMRENVKAVEDRAAQQKLSKDAERRISRLRREFQESFNATVVADRTGADAKDANAQPHIVKSIGVGDQVRLKSMNKIARVEREIDGSTFEVALGPIKMRVKRDDIAEVVTPAQARAAARQTPLDAVRSQRNVRVTVHSASDESIRMEINLIGRTVDEATEELEKYLDKAFLSGLPHVRVIHGHGAGVLRRGVREFLRAHPHVAGIHEPSQAEGGQGATVVELRQ